MDDRSAKVLSSKEILLSCLSTGPGVYHGALKFDANSEDFIDAAQLLPYPSRSASTTTSETPRSIALTEFHFILLYKDRVASVSNLNEQVTYEESLPLVSHFCFQPSNFL